MAKLSAIILTYNEERNIDRCLKSMDGLADEVIVVDSFSTDQTEAICKRHNVCFVQHNFEGYIEQKNYALGLATHDWVLSLDADEALSEALKKSIEDTINNPACDGYYMNRLANYCGQWIRHSGWYPDKKMRFFNRNKGHWAGTNPHDRFELEKGSKTGHLQGDLLHYTFYTVKEHLHQIERFSTIAAKAKIEQGQRSSWWKMLIKPIAKFLKSYFLKLGVLDGYYGWLIARHSAKATYLKYKKMRNLQRAT